MEDEQQVVDSSDESIAARIEASITPQPEEKPSRVPQPNQTPERAEEEEPQPQGEPQGEEEQGEPTQPEETEFEWEFEGETYRLPAKLKPLTEAQMRQADYTRKTQEVAEHRKFVEAQAKQLQEAAQFHASAQKEFAELQVLDGKLEQFKQVNWSELWDKDPVEAGKLRIMRDEIKDARDRLTSDLTQKQQQFQATQQQHRAEMIAKGQEILQREIKGWSPELAKSIRDNAQRYGFTETELGTVVDPRMVTMMNDAYQFQRMKAANLHTKLVPTSTKTVKPGAATNATEQRTGKVTEAKERLRKSGSINDAAGLLMARWR